MPAILTHDFFGRDAFDQANDVLGGMSSDQRDAFLLGNQGPDPLFYLVIEPRVDASMRVGGLMHHEAPTRLLRSLNEAVGLLPGNARAVGEAYVAGFLCHYLLDRAMHPFVYFWQYAICDAGVAGLDRADGSFVHAEIERDLDEMVLYAKTGLTVREYRPYREVLTASDHVLDVIDKLYFYACLWTYGKTLDANVYTRAVKAFRLAQRLFWLPASPRREALGAVERLATGSRYSLLCAMAHRVRAERTSAFDNRERHAWANPFADEISTQTFWDLYEAALLQVRASEELFSSRYFDEEDAWVLTGGRNFSGELVDDRPARVR